MKRKITLKINGKTYSHEVEPRLLLIHYLREVAALTGPHIGCETSICGACTVTLDGKAVKSCTMAHTTIKQETLVGKRIRRKEDPRLITGTATYVDDIQMPGMHHACILRSPHAAAKIRAIHADAARSHPGVVAVFTGVDIKGV